MMWRERWFEHYAQPARLERVLHGMASRRPRLAALRDSYHDFTQHYDQLEALFLFLSAFNGAGDQQNPVKPDPLLRGWRTPAFVRRESASPGPAPSCHCCLSAA